MTPTEKQYVEKLKELVTVLKRQLDIMTDNKNTNVIECIGLFNLNKELQSELASLEQQIAEEEKTVSDEEKINLIKSTLYAFRKYLKLQNEYITESDIQGYIDLISGKLK